MFKRMFGSEKKEEVDKIDTGPSEEPSPPTPSTPPSPSTQPPPPSPPPEPTVEIDPEEIEEVLAEIIVFLNDIGLDDDDIIDAASVAGGFHPVTEYGSPGESIVSFYNKRFREDLSAIQGYKYIMIHRLMANSRLGMLLEWKGFDEDLLDACLKPTLGSFGVDIDFSDHEYDKSFQISVRKGNLERVADVDQSSGLLYLDNKMDIINNLIDDFGLIYLDIDNTGGDFCQYFLFENEHLAAIRIKYGDFFEEVLKDLSI